MDSRRAESFSDGVFAVAITVLVFDLLPIGAARLTTGDPLGHAWPHYVAYVVSFLTIGIMWINHHGMLAQISKVDRTLLILNLLLLMGIVALPFPTALVARHLTSSEPEEQVATVAYGVNMIAISVTFAVTWLYLAGHSVKLGGSQRLQLRAVSSVRFTAGNVGYIVGTVIAALGFPVPALIIFGLLAVYYMFEHLPTELLPGGEEADDG